MEQLESLMKTTLANHFAFYIKAQNFHWNVLGADFKQYHSLFGDIYEEVYSAIDTLAEEIRALGVLVDARLSVFAANSSIADETDVLNLSKSPMSMVNILLTDISKIENDLLAAYDEAEAFGNHGLSNILAERQDAFRKHAWMLRATLGRA